MLVVGGPDRIFAGTLPAVPVTGEAMGNAS
jgi:hypothetical protein